MDSREYDLENRILSYAAELIRFIERLPKSRTANHVASQLLRSGTSPLSNHGEAQAAESPADFVHKMRVCLKEFRESFRWLLLIRLIPLINPASDANPLIAETDELIRIFVASIRTTERKMRRQKGTDAHKPRDEEEAGR